MGSASLWGDIASDALGYAQSWLGNMSALVTMFVGLAVLGLAIMVVKRLG